MEAADAVFRERLRAARAGDSDAFGELVGPIIRLGISLAYSVLIQLDDAEEAVQEALLRLSRRLPDAATPADLRAYFCRIVLNEAKRYRARRFLFGRRSELAPAVDPLQLGRPERDAHFRGLWRLVFSQVRELTAREREVFLLRAFEDLDFEEIARLLDIRPVTVRRLYSLARARMVGLLRTRHAVEIEFPE